MKNGDDASFSDPSATLMMHKIRLELRFSVRVLRSWRRIFFQPSTHFLSSFSPVAIIVVLHTGATGVHSHRTEIASLHIPSPALVAV